MVSVETVDFAHFARYTRGWNIDLQSCECGNSCIKCFGICTSSVQLAFTEHVPGYCCQGDVPKGTVTLWAPIDPSRLVFHHGHGVDTLDVIVTRSDLPCSRSQFLRPSWIDMLPFCGTSLTKLDVRRIDSTSQA